MIRCLVLLGCAEFDPVQWRDIGVDFIAMQSKLGKAEHSIKAAWQELEQRRQIHWVNYINIDQLGILMMAQLARLACKDDVTTIIVTL